MSTPGTGVRPPKILRSFCTTASIAAHTDRSPGDACADAGPAVTVPNSRQATKHRASEESIRIENLRLIKFAATFGVFALRSQTPRSPQQSHWRAVGLGDSHGPVRPLAGAETRVSAPLRMWRK